MLGFTAFLQSWRRLIFEILGLLVGLQGGRLGGVGEDEVDEDGGEEEEAPHHGEGQGEAPNLVQGATNDRSNDLSCSFTFTTLPLSFIDPPSLRLFSCPFLRKSYSQAGYAKHPPKKN